MPGRAKRLWNQGPLTAAERDLVCSASAMARNRTLSRSATSLTVNTDSVNQLAARWSVDPCACSPAMLQVDAGLSGNSPNRSPIELLSDARKSVPRAAPMSPRREAARNAARTKTPAGPKTPYTAIWGLPDDSFDYDDFVKREFELGVKSPYRAGYAGSGGPWRWVWSIPFLRRLFLQVVEVILDRALIGARNLILIKARFGRRFARPSALPDNSRSFAP